MAGDGSGGEDEEDYMSMAIAEAPTPRFETSAQRRARQKKEAEIRSRPRSKAERAAEEEQARQEALATRLDSSSKGFKMLSKLGYVPGTTLGRQDRDARLDPISIDVKNDRAGIGLGSEKKRKLQEHVPIESKREKLSESDYRARLAKEKEESRNEGLWRGAMSVLELMEEREDEDGKSFHPPEDQDSARNEDEHRVERRRRPWRVNLLYRSLVRHRSRAERAERLRHGLNEQLHNLTSPNSQPIASDAHQPETWSKAEEDDDSEDSELDTFEALDADERLARVVDFLRSTYHYCFWCKSRYEDSKMAGCPGPKENDHD